MEFRIFHSAATDPFDARRSEYTSRACFRGRLPQAAPGAGLATACGYYSAWTGRFLGLRLDRCAAETTGALAFLRGRAKRRSRSTPGQTHRAARGKCGAGWTPARGLIFARARCAARRAV